MSLPSGSKRSAIAIAFAFCSGAGLLLAQEQTATTISHQVRDVFDLAAKETELRNHSGFRQEMIRTMILHHPFTRECSHSGRRGWRPAVEHERRSGRDRRQRYGKQFCLLRWAH